jgi:S-adenosylmethionine-diacylglycerol 3-amino-3-carboxypropyl transferase
LKAENYAKLKANADKLTTKIGSITDQIKQNEFGTFNRFIFLDAQDWMNAATMIDLWQAIANKSESGARIIFRTAGASTPIETNLLKDLSTKFQYEEDFSKELFKQRQPRAPWTRRLDRAIQPRRPRREPRNLHGTNPVVARVSRFMWRR